MINKGQKINDRYEIIKSIGEGGMANVYLAHDIILNRDVALKVLRGDLANDEKFVRRFQREALASSSLSHPNIVEMYDVGEDNGTYYIVMEYINGKTLKQLIKKRGALNLSECVDIMLQLTDGVLHAHQASIIHRDLKPQNIMIQDNGEIKITDFGIAVALNNTQLTQTNSVMGSVHYLPPEQASGKGATVKSDIYSMGILFYELLTGNLPFKGDNAVEIALKQIRDDIPSVKDEIPSIPQSIENIVYKATAKNPKNRYSSAKEMHDDLLTALNDDRKDEPKITFKYPEHDSNEKSKTVLEENMSENKKIAKVVEEDNNDNDNTNKVLWILSGIFLFIVIVLIGLFVIYPKVTSSKDVKVPDVKNMTIQEAEETLKNSGFKVNVTAEYESSDEVEKEHVTRTEPISGRTIKAGTEITIYISTGTETYEIEDYTGLDADVEKALLESNHGLKVTIEAIDVDDEDENGNKITYEEGIIIKQDLEVGTKVVKGAKITLYVPNIVTKYPDFSDNEKYTVADVEAFCKKYGVTLNIKYVITSDFEEGMIFYQSRSAGDPIIEGVSLTIKVAQKPEEEEEETTDDDTTIIDESTE